jgi:hypothetical protein
MNRSSREIAFTEEYFFWRTQLNHYSNYRVIVEYSEKLTIDKVYNAITNMMYKYSTLAADVRLNKSTKLEYDVGFADHVQLKDVVEFINNEKFNNIETIMNFYQHEAFKFGSNKPLWKLKIINSKYAVFFNDHIFFDGTSGKNFHIEFSKQLKNPLFSQNNTLDSTVFDKSMVDFDEYQITPKPTDIINFNAPLGYTILRLITEFAPRSITNFFKYWFSQNPYAKVLTYNSVSMKSLKLIPEENNECRNLHLTSDKVNSLIKISRSYNVKLTSLIITLAHLSMAQYISYTGDDVKTNIPVNLRPLIDLEKAKQLCSNFSPLFGLYVGVISLELPCITKICPDGKLNWDLVKYINEKIHNNIDKSAYDFGLLRLVNTKRFIIDKYAKNDKSTLEISNLGVLPDNDNMIQAWFDQPSEIFSINMISTTKGSNLVLRSANTDFVDGFRETIEILIDELIKENA